MTEHRLIERIFEPVQREVLLAKQQGKISTAFVETVVDFIRKYADKTHHGKEEAILFRDLAKKTMAQADQELLQELLEDHTHGRTVVGELIQASHDYAQGQADALARILDSLDALIQFYPEHIRKEDEIFFPRSEQYLSEPEQEAMLLEFWEFDRKMIHDKYRAIVEQAEGRHQLEALPHATKPHHKGDKP